MNDCLTERDAYICDISYWIQITMLIVFQPYLKNISPKTRIKKSNEFYFCCSDLWKPWVMEWKPQLIWVLTYTILVYFRLPLTYIWIDYFQCRNSTLRTFRIILISIFIWLVKSAVSIVLVWSHVVIVLLFVVVIVLLFGCPML